MKFERTLMGLRLEHPLMNAAGVCKRVDGKLGSDELARSATAAVVIGSITTLPREGNAGTNYFRDTDRGFSLNALGLPNLGLPYYRDALRGMIRSAQVDDLWKPVGVSIAGFNPDDFATLAEAIVLAGVDFGELNFGCPNVRDGGKAHRVICYDLGVADDCLTAVERCVSSRLPLAVKVSPILDGFALRDMTDMLSRHPSVRAVTAINTLAGGYAPNPDDPKKPAIAAVFGGIAGPAIKPVAIGQVRQLRAALPECVQIIGVGGIRSGQDVLDFLEAGADAVQMATTLLDEGASAFGRILGEMVSLAA